MAIGLALHALHDAAHSQILDRLTDALRGTVFERLVPLGLAGGFVVWLVIVGREHFEGKAEGVTAKRVFQSLGPGIVAATAIVVTWHIGRWDHLLLHESLGTAALLLLALAGAIKYVSEKVGVEAEAQGAAEASVIYSRARRALDRIDRDVATKRIGLVEANPRRERIVLDLGQYALTETESWLRSHRERPLHPPVGS